MKQKQKTLGSALDEFGWKPRGRRILVSAGTIGPMLKARLNYAAMAAEGRLGGPNITASELDTLEEATRLVKEARSSHRPANQSFDRHDVVDAAAAYIETCVRDANLKTLKRILPRISDSDDEQEPFYLAVYDLVRLYAQGERLTRHRSGDQYEALRAPFVALLGGGFCSAIAAEADLDG